MAKETVEAILSAELNAAEREKQAIQKRESIIAEAKQKSAALMTSMVNEALAKAEHDVNQAIQQGNEKMEVVKENVQKQALFLKTMAKEKEQEAIKLVLASVI